TGKPTQMITQVITVIMSAAPDRLRAAHESRSSTPVPLIEHPHLAHDQGIPRSYRGELVRASAICPTHCRAWLQVRDLQPYSGFAQASRCSAQPHHLIQRQHFMPRSWYPGNSSACRQVADRNEDAHRVEAAPVSVMMSADFPRPIA